VYAAHTHFSLGGILAPAAPSEGVSAPSLASSNPQFRVPARHPKNGAAYGIGCTLRHVIPNGVLIHRRLFAFVNMCGFNHLQL
jgi:hypothetical protein